VRRVVTVEIDPDLEAGLASPLDGLVEVVLCSHDVWIAGIFLKCPVPNWYTDSIETSSSNPLKV
jgi:hypothetical protein